MEKLSFTLYEIFGYFLPGVVSVLALAMLFWAIFLPAAAIPVHSIELSKLWYFGLIVVSYYAGHVLQGVSRSLFQNPDDVVLARAKNDLSIIKRAQEQLAAHLGMTDKETPSSSATARLCDEVAVQHGQLGDRDVFVYREGFYRGSFAAFLLLLVALIVRTIVSGAALRLPAEIYVITRGQLFFVMVVVGASILFLWQRYKHFAALRVMHGILAFVSLACFKDLAAKK